MKYLYISTPIISITDCGFVLASAGIFGGSWKYIWSGISILIAMILVGRILSKRKKHAN
jgi:glucose dehydrogenase